MKKVLLLLAIATMLSLSSFAQWSIGVGIGCAYNHPFSFYDKYDYFHYSGHIGPEVDLTFGYQFHERWSIVGGLFFQQNGYGLKVDNTSRNRFNDNYLSLPMVAEYSYARIKKCILIVECGLYAAYWTCSTSSYDVTLLTNTSGISYQDTHGYVSNSDIIDVYGRRFECGLVGGIGCKWSIGTKWGFKVVARYQYALTKQFKETYTLDYFNHNNALVLQVGLSYNISK